MSEALEVITRGVDSSGRVVRGTRQNFQFYDRLNEGSAKGLLVIVQGSFSFAEASAGTHSKAMCMDYRTWNLDSSTRDRVVIQGRDLMGTMWYRTPADGFDPHIHNNLIGDAPAATSALTQVSQYRSGLNGLANRAKDRNPYRPPFITHYRYIEDDMFTDKDRELLQKLHDDLEAYRHNELARDKAEAKRDKERFERMVTILGNQADVITGLINKVEDRATKQQLRRVKENILLALKNDPDVTQKDNPSDDAMGEMNMG